MEAIHFYNKLLTYTYNDNHQYYHSYDNKKVIIKRITDDKNHYIIDINGSVDIVDRKFNLIEKTNINMLIGSDFELFNNIKIIKVGYLLFNREDEIQSVDTLTKLHSLMDRAYMNHKFNRSDAVPNVFGVNVSNKYVNGFYYTYGKKLTVKLSCVKSIYKENLLRDQMYAKCIPFMKNVDYAKAIHICLMYDSDAVSYETAYDSSTKAINKLIANLESIGIPARYANCRIDNPISF